MGSAGLPSLAEFEYDCSPPRRHLRSTPVASQSDQLFQGIFHPIIDSLYDKFLQNKTNNCIEILNQYITDEKFDTNQNEECCICKIGDDEKTVKLKCGHKMHYDCVKTWFIENTVCPICREEHDPIKIEENKKKLEIEKERFELDDSEVLESSSRQLMLKLTPEILTNAKHNIVIMHPLPRNDEVDINIDNDPRAAYFRQMENGLYVRMALILALI